MSIRSMVSLVGATALSAALLVATPGVALGDDPILPLPSPTALDPILPDPSLPPPPNNPLSPPAENPGGAVPGDPTDPDGSPSDGDSKSGDRKKSSKPAAKPRASDPKDPGGDLYPHPPFAPINGNPSAALLQRLYDAQAAQRSLQNRADAADARLQTAQQAVTQAKAGLADARADRSSAMLGARRSIRTIYKSGAPYSVYTAVAPASGGETWLSSIGVTRDGARGNLSTVSGSGYRIRSQSDALASAVDSRDALLAKVTDLRRELRKATATVRAYQRLAASDIAKGVPNPGVPAGYTGGALLWPVRGPVTSEYGNRYDPYYKRWQLHAGLDIAAPTGTPIRAAAAGRVVQAGRFGGYGNYICLAHAQMRDQQMTTCYAHLSQISVRDGQVVPVGSYLGRVGSTGASTGPHLHFEVRLGGRPTDPRLWL